MARQATGRVLAGTAGAWLAGVAVHLQERTLWPAAGYAALLAAGLVLLVVAWRGSRVAGLGMAAALTGAFLAGFGGSGWRAALCMADGLDPALEGRDLVVAGVVASLPQSSASGLRFRFDVESSRLQGREVLVPPRLALGWYAGWHEDATLAGPQLEVGAGQRWRWTVRLRRPHGTINPNGGDWELALLEQGVRATGYVRDGDAELLDRAAGHPVERLRQRVRDAIVANVPDRRIAGVIAALCVGDQGAIEREDWDLFRNTGVAHLMSISGLHVTMFAWLVGLGVGALWRRSARAALLLPTPQAARWGGFAAAAAYALFSGWGVPAQRTVWMLATVTLLRSGGVRWPWLLVLLVAAVVVTALDPWALLQPGFWLSFMAVGLLMASERADARPLPAERLVVASESASGARGEAVGQGVESSAPSEPARPSRLRALAVRFGRHLRADLRTQVVATLGLTPLTLVFFQQVSVVGFAANLVAIPLVTLLVTPLALAGALAAPLWSLAAATIQALLAYLGLLAALPGAVWTVPVAPAWAQLAGIAGAVLLVLPLPWRVRALGIFLAVPLLLPGRALPPAGTFELLALDVGQGTAVIVRTRDHLLVYDAGPQYARDSDAGQRVLLPVLRARGEARIDRLVLSHRDSDHTGGARSVLAALPVAELLSSLEEGHPLLGLGAPAVRCMAGQAWDWDGVRFEVLRPHPEDYAGTTKPNALSCVVRVEGGGRSALLTGDIEKEQEADLVATHGPALRSDMLVAPHHGSRTSSTAAFLDAVAPTTAVFQAGYRSRFGHPAPDVVARYRERGIEVVATPGCGAWHAPAASTDAPSCERERVRRYWHHPGD